MLKKRKGKDQSVGVALGEDQSVGVAPRACDCRTVN